MLPIHSHPFFDVVSSSDVTGLKEQEELKDDWKEEYEEERREEIRFAVEEIAESKKRKQSDITSFFKKG